MIAVAMSKVELAPRAPQWSGELDPATLARCKNQDPVAFRAFVVRYERPVFALLSRLLGRGTHVEDVAQEAFVRAYRAFPSFDLANAARPSTWLLTIATRLALDVKRRRVLAAAPLDAADLVPSGATPETERSRRELGDAIARAAAELSDDQRAVLVLAEFHDMSHAEIGFAVGIPEATVKTRLHRARQHMRSRLRALREDRPEEDDDGR
jgi:RNA polymerase sigma-70 factor, ECF subfamily